MKTVFFLTSGLLLAVSSGNAEAFTGRHSLIKQIRFHKKHSVRAVDKDDQLSVEDVPRGGASSLKKEPDPLPTMTDYRKFALPCLGLWVAGPLLSLIDTSFVGLSGDASMSATQVAALGPATTFFDGATYLFAFLNVASTNLYSSARAQHGEQSEAAESVVRTAARVALLCGIVLTCILQKFTRPLLALYIGKCVVIMH